MPAIGFGTYLMRGEECVASVRDAIDVGYRLIDTAALYDNEQDVGQALRESGVPREELFVTTKIRGRNHGFDEAQEGCRESLRKLGLDYVDLLLIHWPNPQNGRYLDTWDAMVELKEDGLVANIGVSNFTPSTLERIIERSGVTPFVNQIELHPYFQQEPMRELHEQLGITTQAWSPLGRKSDLLTDPLLVDIAARHGVSTAQVALRWSMQLGNVPIPKSTKHERIAQNFEVFGFELNEGDMLAIATLEKGSLSSLDPETAEVL
jgi:diketogulonate reductase-like aldo/keto reductase